MAENVGDEGQDLAGKLAGDGLTSVIMSIDSHDVAKHEKNRGLPDVCRNIQHANRVFHELGIPTTASVTASVKRGWRSTHPSERA